MALVKVFFETLSKSMQHSTNLGSKFGSICLSKLLLVKPLPVPLTRILKLTFFDFLKFSIILKPSFILFVPPVNITIFELSLILYFWKDKTFSLKLNNSIKKKGKDG